MQAAVLAQPFCFLMGHWDTERTTGSLVGRTTNFELFAAPNLLEALSS